MIYDKDYISVKSEALDDEESQKSPMDEEINTEKDKAKSNNRSKAKLTTRTPSKRPSVEQAPETPVETKAK